MPANASQSFGRVRIPIASTSRQGALFVSGTAFGLYQGVLWLPGVMAGAAFGLLYMLIWRLREAVVAHSTWNALTAAVVLAGSQWQLW